MNKLQSNMNIMTRLWQFTNITSIIIHTNAYGLLTNKY